MSTAKSTRNQHKLGRRFDEALRFASDVHRADIRKGSDVPYVAHLLGVCALVLEEGGSEDQAIAALLHDTAEDHGGEDVLAEVRVRFGEAVADIVEACSDTLEEPKPAWRRRKENYLQRLEHEHESVLLVSLADKLYNARAITRDYQLVGDQLWERFNKGSDAQFWYYGSLSEIFARRLPGCRMTHELAAVLSELEALIADEGRRDA